MASGKEISGSTSETKKAVVTKYFSSKGSLLQVHASISQSAAKYVPTIRTFAVGYKSKSPNPSIKRNLTIT